MAQLYVFSFAQINPPTPAAGARWASNHFSSQWAIRPDFQKTEAQGEIPGVSHFPGLDFSR